MNYKIPVILDTDIGIDIDDTWALGMLLNSPEFDVKMVLTCSANTIYRSRLTAKILKKLKRSDIAIGVGRGVRTKKQSEPQSSWLGDYHLDDYPGDIYYDGIAKMIEIVNSESEITIIGIGPMTNIAEFCRQRPDLTKKCRLSAMIGSIHKQQLDKMGAIAEYNVVQDIKGAQTVFAADWKEFRITPLDSCGNIIIEGDLYKEVFNSRENIPRCIIDNYYAWAKSISPKSCVEKASSILYDTVAVHLARCDDWLDLQPLKLRISNDGMMLISSTGHPVTVALGWHDLESFKRNLIDRVIYPQEK